MMSPKGRQYYRATSSIEIKDGSVYSWVPGLPWSPSPSAQPSFYWDRPFCSGVAMVRTSAWVEQQATLDQGLSLEPGAASTPPVTPPPRSNNDRDQYPHTDRPRADPSTRQSLPKYRYDIATLLRLRHTQGAVPVMLRVKPEAIAGKRSIAMLLACFKVG